MKITEVSPGEKLLEQNDYRGYYEIHVNGEKKVSFYEGEPEDGTLGRDFNDVYSIPDLMNMAYEAGLNGEELEIEQVEE